MDEYLLQVAAYDILWDSAKQLSTQKKAPKAAPGKTLLLKVVPANMTTQNDFVWPESGPVECPDWKPCKACGNGLHAWRWAPGCNPGVSEYTNLEDAKWLLVETSEDQIVDLGDKVKFKAGVVIFCGKFEDAIKSLQPDPSRAGFKGTATAGDEGTATAGDEGTATAGDRGTATAGDRGTITILFWDPKKERYRRLYAEVGETPGIEPGKRYKVESGAFVEAL